jgi:ubiquinone/menaquinone biosynthesis C-methylase UbiE
VVSKYAVQHERNLEKTYREFARVLKPGGRLVILATHPITLWLAKSHKDYFTKEEVVLPLYNSKVIVRDEAQTMMDYLNQTALTKFKLLSLEEGFEPTTENQLPPAIYPTYLILNMIKAN